MESVTEVGRAVAPAPRRRGIARASRILGTTAIVIGIGLFVWAFTVWRWEDPFTSVYATWQQRQLDSDLQTLIRERPAPRPTAGESPRAAAVRVRQEAQRFRAATSPGSPIGRLRVPRLGLTIVMVEGTDSSSLRKGPGRDERTFMPGQGKLVYVAGHRTTYSAPFAHIDRLRPGDPITVEMPYGTFRYVVTRSRIVDDEDLTVLESGRGEEIALQACHPRFFATQRYIVWAQPTRPVAIDGRKYAGAIAR